MIPCVESHLDALEAAGYREQDEEECYASSFKAADECARDGLKRAPFDTYTIMAGLKPAGVFGVTPLEGETGIPWMLCTERFYEVIPDFRRQCRAWIDHFNLIYPFLVNIVMDSNEAAKKWLQWCGFRLLDAQPLGPTGTVFRTFERVRNV